MTRTIGIGHNNAPLKELLAEAHEALRVEIADLLDDAVALDAAIKIDDESGRASEFVTAARALEIRSEAVREKEKKPFLDAGREVDGFFKALATPLETKRLAIAKHVSVYLNEKVRKEKEAQAKAEKIAREEADRKLAEAAATQGTVQSEAALSDAVTFSGYADEAAAVVAAKPSELARNTTASGVTTTLKTRWVFEITNLSLVPLEVLRAYIPQDAVEKAIRDAVKYGVRDLAGVRIFEQSDAVFRK